MKSRSLAVAVLLFGTFPIPSVAQAPTCQFIGQRIIKGLWLESGYGLQISPDQPFDDNRSCTVNTTAVVAIDHPQFKNIHAMALLAMATGRPINAYGCGCVSGWGNTYPTVLSFGVRPIP